MKNRIKKRFRKLSKDSNGIPWAEDVEIVQVPSILIYFLIFAVVVLLIGHLLNVICSIVYMGGL